MAAFAEALRGKTLYTDLAVYPTLVLDRGPDYDDPKRAEWEERVERGQESAGPKPVKTVPAHRAAVRLANEGDVAQIFGEEGAGMFAIGETIEQNYPVRLDLNRFVKRSSGIFGATGTGKSFLTRIVLAGLMKEDVAAALVFDMHNEYAFDDLDADRERYLYVGDSPNDAPMFAYFPHSVGVANVRDFEGALEAEPAYVCTQRGGGGFVELCDRLLRARGA